MAKIDTNVGHLVDMIERGELRLPELQRRYVWPATRVRDLLDSLYHLDRPDLEWILDAPYPSASFPGLKRNEGKQFGEYRTQRYVLHAYDQLARGEAPDLEGV